MPAVRNQKVRHPILKRFGTPNYQKVQQVILKRFGTLLSNDFRVFFEGHYEQETDKTRGAYGRREDSKSSQIAGAR